MIDFNRWIYAKDIAAWMAKNVSLNLEEQIDCICAAPHRTLEEKLMGVKELKSEYDGKALCNRIENIEMVLHHSRSGIHIYLALKYFTGEKKSVFCRIGYSVQQRKRKTQNFLYDTSDQWLIYPAPKYRNQTHGIGFVNLRSDKIPFENSSDFIFPYKQLIHAYEGELKENEIWLSEFSGLVEADKSCIEKMLHDREPKNCGHRSMDEERLKYVRELAEKQR